MRPPGPETSTSTRGRSPQPWGAPVPDGPRTADGALPRRSPGPGRPPRGAAGQARRGPATPAGGGEHAVQRSFDDLGVPLVEVTFVVIDFETTGASPADCAITEVGAVKLRGGVCLGTFQTLVNPGTEIPPFITYLTGITESMVGPAPGIEAVLPSLTEFIGDAVVVGHNVAFDVRFLNAARQRCGHGPVPNRVVDTCGLARRLLREEVPDCKLGTLADRFRLEHRPSHRALDDALATGDLLHLLLERAACYGVLALEDLIEMPTVKGHPQLTKRKLALALPAAPGVYLFRDPAGRVLYVGRAVDLRRRVRSYFSAGEERRKVGGLLRELAAIDHVECSGELEAGVLEVRLIQQFIPRYNRQAKHWRRYAYVKLTLGEAFPRLAVVRTTPDDGGLYLGPVASARTAQLIIEAIESVVAIRRCRHRVSARRPRPGSCVPAQLGVAVCPCAGEIGGDDYGALVAAVIDGLGPRPQLLLDPLRRRIEALAGARRFEEAAETRDRAGALARALARQRRFDALRRSARLVVEVPGEGGAVLAHGRLVATWTPGGQATTGGLGWAAEPCGPAPGPDRPLAREAADELVWVAQWLERRATTARIVETDAGLAWPTPRLPDFAPGTRLVS